MQQLNINVLYKGLLPFLLERFVTAITLGIALTPSLPSPQPQPYPPLSSYSPYTKQLVHMHCG